jgi:hypothetical protein
MFTMVTLEIIVDLMFFVFVITFKAKSLSFQCFPTFPSYSVYSLADTELTVQLATINISIRPGTNSIRYHLYNLSDTPSKYYLVGVGTGFFSF